MLREIRLANFKIHRNAVIDLGAITVLIGKHGTGKSTILQSLQLLLQSAGREGLNLNGPWIKDVRFGDLIHRQNEREIMGIGLQFEFPERAWPISEGEGYKVTYDISFDNRGFRDQRAVYDFGDSRFEFWSPKTARPSMPPTFRLPERPEVNFRAGTFTLLPFLFYVEGRDYTLHQAWMQAKERIRNYFLMSMQIVPAERIITRGEFPDQGGGQALLGNMAAIEDVVNRLAYQWDIGADVSAWMNEVLQRRINCRLAEERIVIEIANGAPLSIMAEGSGVRQLVWLLTALASAGPGSLILVEEPEIHLHPAAQAKLCEVLVNQVRETEKQLVITTHSEHILMAFLTAVARGELAPDDLAIYSFAEERGTASAVRLEVDERGMVQGGLPGFFEQNLDEIKAFLEASGTKGDER